MESQDTTRTTVVDVLCVQPTAVTILAGTTEPGFANGVLSETHNNLLNFPQGIMQPDANTLLIADRSNGLVRKFNLKNNELSTFAGAGAYVEGALLDGAAPVSVKAAQLIAPSSLCADPTDKNSVFVASDDVQKVIRLIGGDGNVKIVAGSVDGREPDPEDQTAMTAWVEKCLEPVTTALQATFSDIACVLPAKLKGTEEELIYMSCMSSNCIRSYNPRTGEVKKVVGIGMRGSHTEGALEDPFGLAVDSQGRLLISSLEGYTILRFDPSIDDTNKQLECLAGRSGTRWFRDGMGATDSLLGDTAGMTVDPFDTVYFCDYAHGAIRAISPEGYVYTIVCADQSYTEVSFNFAAPFGIHFDRYAYLAGRPCLYVIDFHRLIRIDLDPLSFPTPEQPQTTGRRQNMPSNPNQYTIEQELELINKAAETGMELVDTRHSDVGSRGAAPARPSGPRSRTMSKKSAGERGVRKVAAPVSARVEKSFAAPTENGAAEPERNSASSCSMM